MFWWQSLIASWHYSTYTPFLCIGEHPTLTPADIPINETSQFLQPFHSQLLNYLLNNFGMNLKEDIRMRCMQNKGHILPPAEGQNIKIQHHTMVTRWDEHRPHEGSCISKVSTFRLCMWSWLDESSRTVCSDRGRGKQQKWKLIQNGQLPVGQSPSLQERFCASWCDTDLVWFLSWPSKKKKSHLIS